MELNQDVILIEPGYLENICEDIGLSSRESCSSDSTSINTSIGNEQNASWSTYSSTSQIEAWYQYKFDYLIY